MFRTKVVDEFKTHFIINNFFFENRAFFCDNMENVL